MDNTKTLNLIAELRTKAVELERRLSEGTYHRADWEHVLVEYKTHGLKANAVNFARRIQTADGLVSQHQF